MSSPRSKRVGIGARPPANPHAEAWIRQGDADALNKGDLYTARLTLDVTPALRARIKIAADRPLYDQLWQQYWAQVLCSPPNASLQPLHELGTRLGEIAATIESTSTMPGGTSYAQAARAVPRSDGVDVQALAQQLDRRADGQPLEQASQDAYSVAADMRYAIERARRKTMLFGL